LLHIRGNVGEPEQYVFTFAGYLGANGLNARAIGICANAMPQLRHARAGLPVAFVIRTVLKQTNATEAARWLQEAQHATSQNYILGVGDSVYDFECSAGKVVRYTPHADGALVYHTNHPLTNDNVDAEFLAHVRRVDPEGKALDSTGARFQHQSRPRAGWIGLEPDCRDSPFARFGQFPSASEDVPVLYFRVNDHAACA
jgi:hypothetical protein